MNQLDLFFRRKKYPYSELHDPGICWSQIALAVTSRKGRIIRVLFDWEWDLRCLLGWLKVNKINLLEQECPLENINGEHSIAALIFHFYDSDEEYDDDLIDKIFNYRAAHGIRFALSGTDVPNIYLGKNNGRHEVSFFDGVISWSYEIDMKDFFNKIESNQQLSEIPIEE